MKRLIALTLLGLVAAIGCYAQPATNTSTDTPQLYVQSINATACRNLSALIPVMQPCLPHLELIAYGAQNGDAIRLSVTWKAPDASAGQKSITLDVDATGTAVWICNIPSDFVSYTASAALLKKSGVAVVGSPTN